MLMIAITQWARRTACRWWRRAPACTTDQSELDYASARDTEIVRFVKERLADAGPPQSDPDHFLAWRQRDQISRQAPPRLPCGGVDRMALAHRLAAARFRQLVLQTPARLEEIGQSNRLRVHLNPEHVWAGVHSTGGETDADAPAVMLFARPEGMRSMALTRREAPLIERLRQDGSMPLKKFLAGLGRNRAAAEDRMRQLASDGLIALS